MDSSFNFTSVRILESLADGEPKTGEHLASYIEGLESAVPVSIVQWSSAQELFVHLDGLVERARKGDIPVLHLEAHGNQTGTGLVASSGEFIPWTAITPYLQRLNIATKFNLVVFLAACSGGYFLEEIRPLEVAPCFALVAPTDEIGPGEIMGGTRDFYRALVKDLDVVAGIRMLAERKLDVGGWYSQLAELWYRTGTLHYLRTQCSNANIDMRAQRMYQRAIALGKPCTLDECRQSLIALNRQFAGRHFDTFFATAQVPGNVARFAQLRDDVRSKADELLSGLS